MSASLKNLSKAPKRNCPPKAKHRAGKIDAGFLSLSGLKFTLADVLLYVALGPLALQIHYTIYNHYTGIYIIYTSNYIHVNPKKKTFYFTIICKYIEFRK